MYVYSMEIEAPDDFTRIKMIRKVAGVTSTLFIDLRHRWPYEDCRYWVNIRFEGWRYIRAEYYAYTPGEQQWVKVPGVVLPS